MGAKFAKVFLVKGQTLHVLFDPFTKVRTITSSGKTLVLQGLIKMSNTDEIMSSSRGLSMITDCFFTI